MKKTRKFIAILLTMLTLMSVVSAATPVLAVEVTEITETTEAPPGTADTTEAEESGTATDEPEILNEMVEWRTESTKYFRNSDGSYTAAQYAFPVHYKENGEWKEIDNTLTEKSVNSSLSNGEMAFVADKTDTPASFPEKFKEDGSSEISITAEGHKISFSPKGTKNDIKESKGKVKEREDLDSVKIADIATEKQEASTFKLKPNSEKLNKREHKKNEKFKVENKSGAIVYENVYDNVDLEYELNNSKLKESIVLNEKHQDYTFSFDMDLGGLYPVLCEDGSINLCTDTEGENPVAKIEAPYMIDSNGEYSNAVTMTIEQNKNQYILTVTADKNWLNDEKRAFPVVIDPTIDLQISRLNTIDCYVDNSQPSTPFPTDYYIYAGHSTLGKTRTFIKFKLPNLPDDNCIITNAFIRFNQNSVDKGSSDGYLTIHEVTENWNNTDSSLKPTWNNQPEYNEKVIDYSKVEYNKDNIAHCYDFDITRIIKEWYENDKLETNYGFMLKSSDESVVNRAQLYSAENSREGAYPAIYVNFRNNKGLESYWSYSSFGVGVAGTAHINDYTGNLVYELPIASSISEIMPVDIVGYYNNYCANELISETEAENVRTSIGRGFRLNYQQTVLPSSKYGLTSNNAERYPYVYTDSDGTEHYIQKVVEKVKNDDGEEVEKTVYKDEDGLGLTLTTGLDDNGNKYYKIKDKAHNTYYFNFRGNLSRIKDNNGNELKIIYKDADSGNNLLDRSRISQIIDGAGHTYKFTYYIKSSTGVELDYVKSIEDDAKRKVEFDISGGLLNEVTYYTGDTATFDYNISSNNSSEGRINAVTSNDSYELNFDYTSKKTGRRVSMVKEYGRTGAKGQVITFDRSKYNTTIMRSCGLDGIHNSSSSTYGDDDIITTVQYDNMGRAISQQMKFGSGDEIGSGSVAYTTSDSDETASGFKNKVSGSGATGKYVENLLYNGNAESDSHWSFEFAGSVEAKDSISTASKYIGKKSLKLEITSITAKDGRCYYRQNYTDNIKKNTEYTLSAYVKTGDLVPYSNTSSTGAFIQIIGYDSKGDAISSVQARSQVLNERTDMSVNNGWRRLSCTVTTTEDVISLRCYLYLRNTKGSVCFDGIQLEKGATVNDYNMLENSHFTMLSGKTPLSWSKSGDLEFSTGTSVTNGVVVTKNASGDNTYAMKITGEPDALNAISQTVTVEGDPDDTYILSGWGKADAVNSTFHTELTKGSDTETTDDDEYTETALFEIGVRVNYSVSDGTTHHQYKPSAQFNTTISDWQCASVPIVLKCTDGDSGKTYTPKSIRVILKYKNQENFAYFDKIMLVKDAASSYTYDKDGNLISASSNSEQKANMKYDDKDNLTSYTDPAGFKTELVYENNNNLNYTRSAKGVYTNYGYDDNGNVTSSDIRNKGKIAEATAVIKTETGYYEGDTSGGVTINEGAYKTQNTDQNGNVTKYTPDHKTGVVTKVTDAKNVETVYEYEDNFGRQESVSVKNSKVTYNYNTNKQLSSIVFGNNITETYSFTYDTYGNIKTTKVGSQELSTNTYLENNGLLKKNTYGNDDIKRFTYNNFGQQTQVYGTDAHSSSTAEKLLYSWEYNDSGVALSHIDHVNGLKYIVDYDSIGRLSKEEVKNSSTSAFVGSTEYGYDVRNNLTNLITNYGGKANKQQYFYTQVAESTNSVDYQEDNLPTMYKLNDGVHALYRYDGLNRYNQRKLVLGENTNLYYNYNYKLSDRNAENETKYKTNQVEKEYIGDDVYIYGYNVLGNITSIKKAERSDKGSNETSHTTEQDYVTYSYDDLGQLTRENLVGKNTTVWDYDELGNITSKSEYAYTTVADLTNETASNTVTYYYQKDGIVYEENTEQLSGYSSWNNILLAVDLNSNGKISNSETIKYDEIGNPEKYLGAELEWNGRELTRYQISGKDVSYTYDSNGSRASKIQKDYSVEEDGSKTLSETTETKYYYVNGQLHFQDGLTTEADGSAEFKTKLYFYYDSNGYLTGIEYNNTMYYPATNLKGDVVAIYDSNGSCVAKYEYDAWGKVISVTDGADVEITDQSHIAHINPIRYRGYYYDSETKLYYLQSRYYNPEVGRFLNADSLLPDVGGEVMGYNMFSYCLNNPVNMSDPTGHWPSWATVALGVAAAVVAVAVTVATLGVAAPAAACTLAAVGMSYGASYAVATTVATVAVAATTVVASAYAADVAYSSVTGDSVLLDTVFQGNTDLYETGMMLTSFATAGMFELAANSPGVCFVAGTLVSTLFGKTKIENIKAGDKVWAENPETGQKELKTVVRTFENESSELVHIFVDGEEITTTPTHPFYVPQKGWIDAIKLRVGDVLVLRNGDYVIIEKVQHEILETPITVYNFEVEDFHTYYVGNSSILVHNANCEPKRTQKGQTPRNNQAQNRQFDSVIKELGLNRAQRRRLHDATSGKGYSRDDIIDEALYLFPELEG